MNHQLTEVTTDLHWTSGRSMKMVISRFSARLAIIITTGLLDSIVLIDFDNDRCN